MCPKCSEEKAILVDEEEELSHCVSCGYDYVKDW